MILSKNPENDIGVVLCDCGGELRKRLDFAQLSKEMNEANRVAAVKVCSKFCDVEECSDVVKALSASGATRLIIGGCSRENFETPLHEALRKEKLNSGLWWSVNICEQCALVHSNKKASTAKAIERLSAAASRVRLADPVTSEMKAVRQNVVVAGGGIAGMQAAVTLEKLGHQVTMILRNRELGGVTAAMPELYRYLGNNSSDIGEDADGFVNCLINRVKDNKNIKIYSKASLKSSAGELGNFLIAVTSNGKERVLNAGAVVLATGSNSRPASETVGIEKSARVVDMSGLLRIIRSGDVPKRVAIVMDITGEQTRAVSAQVFSAAELLTKRYNSQVKVYCNNARVAATGLEALYRRARESGVIVVKSSKKPVISVERSKIVISSEDTIVSTQVSDEFDIIVMADLPVPGNNGNTVDIIKGLKGGPEGIIQYDDVWLLPALTNRPGVFVIGAARGNSEYREALTDGLAVANEIHSLLGEKQIEVFNDAAFVDSDKCVLCLTCLRICPHGAISIDDEEKAACISPVSCQRCGICAAECPAQAIKLPGFTDEEITAEIGSKPRVTVFACENSALPAANAAGLNGCEYGSDVELIRVPCAGRVDPKAVLTALESGAEKVLVLGCHPESCKYLTGSSRSARRINRLAEVLGKSGFDTSRVFFGGIASVEPQKFLEYVTLK